MEEVALGHPKCPAGVHTAELANVTHVEYMEGHTLPGVPNLSCYVLFYTELGQPVEWNYCDGTSWADPEYARALCDKNRFSVQILSGGRHVAIHTLHPVKSSPKRRTKYFNRSNRA